MKKFIESKLIEDYEVLTDEGWVDILAIHKTIPYKNYKIKTTDFELECADKHIVFDSNYNEVYVENLNIGDIIITENGKQKVIYKEETGEEINMYDLEIESNKKRYFTNGILSHNTTYIKYLTSLIKGKDILFVPPSMADILSEPSIIPFLIENSNSILLIEDGEKVISDRETNPSYASGVSNLLNMTDGILGDCLNIQVIVTFNMEREKIDKALLRNGRLICEHKFESLNINESNALLRHLKKDYITTKPMTLADIYNVDSITYREKNDKTKMGFK